MPRGKNEGSLFKDGRGYWSAVIELPSGPDGKRRRKTIRSVDKKTVLLKLREMQADLKLRGDLPSAETTVAEWFTHWFEHIAIKSVRPTTAQDYRNVVYNHVIPTIGRLKLSAVKPDHIRKVTDRVTELGLSSSHALKVHRVMGVAFKEAVRENRLGRSPVEYMVAPRKAPPKLEVLTLAEAIQVLEHVSHLPMGARWAVSLLTGARRGEVLGLQAHRVTDVLDFSWQLQRLPGARKGEVVAPVDYEYQQVSGGLYLTRPKSSAGWRVIPLVDPLRAILTRHMEANPPGADGFLFTKDGKPLDPDEDSREWRRVFAATGIQKNIRAHDLRHGWIDAAFAAGVPEDLIMDMAGHSTVAMTRAYKSRMDQGRARVAMQQISAPFALSRGLGDTDAA
jgi:integrase